MGMVTISAQSQKENLLNSILNGEIIEGRTKRNLIDMIEDELEEDSFEVEYKVKLNLFVESLFDERYWKSDELHDYAYGCSVRDFYNYIRKKTPEQLGFRNLIRSC